ncbi:MAG: HNH endonuclease [Acidaminococcales bacterium]|jgi:hypothetical protein|nr:HNH endonuclease [Acidaminococcales bacterium]
MEDFIQEFNPPVKIHTGKTKQDIKKRVWQMDGKAAIEEDAQNMVCLGQYNIEEVWKHYDKDCYISNYGYVARIEEKQAIEIFQENLFAKFKSEEGVRYIDLTQTQKAFMRNKNIVPVNKVNSGCQIWLLVAGIGDVHRMVAEKFLKKPAGDAKRGWGVHHIDNNSYNNSVTNLIWLKQAEQHSTHHKKLHPMSH